LPSLRTEKLNRKHLERIENLDKISPDILRYGDGYAVVDDTGVCYIAAVFLPLGESTVEMSMLRGDINQNIFTARWIREGLYNYILANNYERVHAITKDDSALTRWMEFLRFKREATLKKFFNGEDRVMWVKFREELI